LKIRGKNGDKKKTQMATKMHSKTFKILIQIREITEIQQQKQESKKYLQIIKTETLAAFLASSGLFAPSNCPIRILTAVPLF
jgi:hypothetical protein